MQSAEINMIATALAKAQANIHCPSRNREVKVRTRAGDTYKFAYTTFDNLIEAVRGPLTTNGIWFVQSYDEWDDEPAVMTTLVHSSGQWFSTTTPMFIKDEPTNQEFGSAFTYSRRYGLSAALGISSEEDDDANSADGNQAEGRDRAPKAANDNKPKAANDNVYGDTQGNVRKYLPPVDPKTGKVVPHTINDRSGVIDWGGSFIAALDQAKSLDEVKAWESLNLKILDAAKEAAPKVYAKVLARLLLVQIALGALPPVQPNKFLTELDEIMAACKTRKGVETAWSNKQSEIDKLAPADFDAFAKLFDTHLERVAPRKQ